MRATGDPEGEPFWRGLASRGTREDALQYNLEADDNMRPQLLG